MKLNPNKVGIAVTCTICHQTKQPRGRSAPLEAYLCNTDCPGFDQPPVSGDLWPGESEADFGFHVRDEGVRYESH